MTRVRLQTAAGRKPVKTSFAVLVYLVAGTSAAMAKDGKYLASRERE